MLTGLIGFQRFASRYYFKGYVLHEMLHWSLLWFASYMLSVTWSCLHTSIINFHMHDLSFQYFLRQIMCHAGSNHSLMQSKNRIRNTEWKNCRITNSLTRMFIAFYRANCSCLTCNLFIWGLHNVDDVSLFENMELLS